MDVFEPVKDFMKGAVASEGHSWMRAKKYMRGGTFRHLSAAGAKVIVP